MDKCGKPTDWPYRSCGLFAGHPGGHLPPFPATDQSCCDVGLHQQCSGYTEDEADAESCMCECHDLEAR